MLDRKLLEAEPGDPVDTLAQARTSTVIIRLDVEHNASVIRFLSDSGLDRSGEASISILRGIALNGADLSGADLSALDDLREADLGEANLSDTFLPNADLRYARLIDTDLSGAYLYGANLSYANLSGARLSRANLREANLRGADVIVANLGHADLRGARGVTNEQLEQQARILEGATMPNGQKYEDWLKSKGRGEDGENPGP
jgi:uncharacterized protein YjbI with pentapeptide repeats